MAIQFPAVDRNDRPGQVRQLLLAELQASLHIQAAKPMSQVNVWLALKVPSPATIVTLYGAKAPAPAAMVPVIAPVVELMWMPGGKPTAVNFRVPELASLALSDSDTASPSRLSWVAMAVKVMGFVIVQLSDSLLL